MATAVRTGPGWNRILKLHVVSAMHGSNPSTWVLSASYQHTLAGKWIRSRPQGNRGCRHATCWLSTLHYNMHAKIPVCFIFGCWNSGMWKPPMWKPDWTNYLHRLGEYLKEFKEKKLKTSLFWHQKMKFMHLSGLQKLMQIHFVEKLCIDSRTFCYT